jgi:unsaturated chondroitin disaccharide hydrolase
MLELNKQLTPAGLLPKLDRFWTLSAISIDAIEKRCPPGSASPVFTVDGRYTAQGWTEWTQGFQYGSALLQYDATSVEGYLELGRTRTLQVMAPHLTHMGVHDHGFNNVSTYGNLWRLICEGLLDVDPWEQHFYQLALKVSGAVQAARWAKTDDGTGYMYSFNGPQSLFVDTIRSCRALAIAHQLGHRLMGEQDEKINLLGRLLEHLINTARYNVWYGQDRDAYDLRGRTAHESIFNTINGKYRCPSTQQGYSAMTTWTRGLAWAMLGFAEQLEWLTTRATEFAENEVEAASMPRGGPRPADPCAIELEFDAVERTCLNAAMATCDFYLQQMPACGIPYWDTGAPGLANLPGHQDRPADPFNPYEPVDSSAAAIAAQGLIRLSNYLQTYMPEVSGLLPEDGADSESQLYDRAQRYLQAGLTVMDHLLDEPYLSTDPAHEGLILHSVYHRPNQWDHIPRGQSVPCGESSMWGDYHAREAALLLSRLAKREPYHTFFGTGLQ